MEAIMLKSILIKLAFVVGFALTVAIGVFVAVYPKEVAGFTILAIILSVLSLPFLGILLPVFDISCKHLWPKFHEKWFVAQQAIPETPIERAQRLLLTAKEKEFVKMARRHKAYTLLDTAGETDAVTELTADEASQIETQRREKYDKDMRLALGCAYVLGGS